MTWTQEQQLIAGEALLHLDEGKVLAALTSIETEQKAQTMWLEVIAKLLGFGKLENLHIKFGPPTV